MGIKKWYEITCDICGESININSIDKDNLIKTGYFIKNNKVYCSNECYDLKLKEGEKAIRDYSGKLIVYNTKVSYIK